jgi:hypothetical protein
MATPNALEFIRTADIEERFETAVTVDNAIDLDTLPDGLVTGTTLLDLSAVTDPQVRSGVSLSMLFASRVAANDASADDPDAWLASYQSALGRVGFALSGSAMLNSSFKKTNVGVHRAIIPFLTIALGGAAAGPVLISLLENLGDMAPDSPWITMYDRQVRRFDVQEMHFGAARSVGLETEIRYAVARLNLEMAQTSVLFFNITSDKAQFESMTTSMQISNSLMAVIEPDLRLKLAKQSKKFIWDANLG